MTVLQGKDIPEGRSTSHRCTVARRKTEFHLTQQIQHILIGMSLPRHLPYHTMIKENYKTRGSVVKGQDNVQSPSHLYHFLKEFRAPVVAFSEPDVVGGDCTASAIFR